jgi:Cys-tRNA synthase (O-phospho-L-seryl-tRNA:Cys-tRNA synthase)
MEKCGKLIAKWDTRVAKIYNEICVEEVNASNMPQHYLNAEGYANMIRMFKERTGRTYTRECYRAIIWDAQDKVVNPS